MFAPNHHIYTKHKTVKLFASSTALAHFLYFGIDNKAWIRRASGVDGSRSFWWLIEGGLLKDWSVELLGACVIDSDSALLSWLEQFNLLLSRLKGERLLLLSGLLNWWEGFLLRQLIVELWAVTQKLLSSPGIILGYRIVTLIKLLLGENL